MEIKPVQITKNFKRVVTDGNYGSVTMGTEITSTVNVNTKEEMITASNTIYEQALTLTMLDIKKYFEQQKERKVI